MKHRDRGRIAELDSSYQRGLVQGLTMAEAGILIIFVLLLLLAHSVIRHARETQGRTAVDSNRLAELERSESQVLALRKSLGATGDSVDEIKRLVRVVQEASNTERGRSALAEARRSLDEIKRARDEIRRVAGSPELGKRVEDQGYRLANQEGQLRYLENKLAQAGNGKGERPCWVQPGGHVDYLFDVVLQSDGIRMREYTYPGRAAERSSLPVPVVDPSRAFSPAEFLASTEALYQRSQDDNCRFFVVVYDGTGAEQKALYKSLLRTVESHFYKRLDDGQAPF